MQIVGKRRLVLDAKYLYIFTKEMQFVATGFEHGQFMATEIKRNFSMALFHCFNPLENFLKQNFTKIRLVQETKIP